MRIDNGMVALGLKQQKIIQEDSLELDRVHQAMMHYFLVEVLLILEQQNSGMAHHGLKFQTYQQQEKLGIWEQEPLQQQSVEAEEQRQRELT